MKMIILTTLFLSFVLGICLLSVARYQDEQNQCFLFQRESRWLCIRHANRSCGDSRRASGLKHLASGL